MFVEPQDVRPMFCFNLQTDISFLLQQILTPFFYNASFWRQGLL